MMHKLVNGKQVPLTDDEILEFQALEAQHLTKMEELALTQYQRDRAVEYPSIKDQLDIIYHSGLDEWKSVISATKTKYPKPE